MANTRTQEFHLDEIAAWQSGDRGSPMFPSDSPLYADKMLDAIKKHELALIKLGHEPTIEYAREHGFAEGKRGAWSET